MKALRGHTHRRPCGSQLQPDLDHVHRLDEACGQHPTGTPVHKGLGLLPRRLCRHLGIRELGLELIGLLCHLVCHFSCGKLGTWAFPAA